MCKTKEKKIKKAGPKEVGRSRQVNQQAQANVHTRTLKQNDERKSMW